MRTILTVLLMVLGLSTTAHAQAQSLSIEMTAPKNQAGVPHRPAVEGTVSDARARVFVIVNPLATPGEFWVQPEVRVQPDKKWRVTIYIGRPGSVDVDKKFAIRAVANPKQPLKEGDVLASWPEAGASSSVVEVVRH